VPDYLLRRLAPTVLVLPPADPACLVAGQDPTLRDIEAVRQNLRLDRPVWSQHGHYLGCLAQLQLGRWFDSSCLLSGRSACRTYDMLPGEAGMVN
jgi:ABC-type dipeptide/oligopeptide/nickel transport system permease component